MILNPYDSQGNHVAFCEGVYPTLRGNGGGGYQAGYVMAKNDNEKHVKPIAVATAQAGAEIMEDKCPTITASAGMSGNNMPYVCYTLKMRGGGRNRQLW